MNLWAALLISITTTGSIALHGIQSAHEPLHIPTVLGIPDKQYGMIFSDDGNHIIVGYFPEANCDEKLEISHYTYNDNKLTKVADQLSSKEECARLLNVLRASPAYPKSFYTQNHAIKIFNKPSCIVVASTPDAAEITKIYPKLEFTHNALFTCAESRGYPLIAHADQSGDSKQIFILNGKTGKHIFASPQKIADARIHEIAFTRITNPSQYTLALLLTKPKYTEIASLNFSLDENGEITGQEIAPTCKISYDRLHEIVSESDPAYVTSFGWAPHGDFCTLVKRIPNYTYLVHPETSECTRILRSYSYYLSPGAQQKKKEDLEACLLTTVPKEIIKNIRQSPVQVSPNRLNIIVDGILVNLSKKEADCSDDKLICFLMLLHLLKQRQ